MGHLQNLLNTVKEKIADYKESKKTDKAEKLELEITEQVVDNEVEDWYHDVGTRGAFKD